MPIAKDPCTNCGSIKWFYFRMICPHKKKLRGECSDCSNASIPKLSPDVYFDSSKGVNQTDPNLCRRDGTPIPFSGKRKKAKILKQKGLREAGDKIHGSRNFDKTASKQWEE